MVVVSILPNAEFGPNDNREDAPHFINPKQLYVLDIHKQIQHFFNMVDVDKSQTISLLEFFIELPKVEAYLLEKKLGK